MNKLKNLREDKDLKQSDIAKILNVSQVSYGRYELGLSEPSIASLIKLANFYGVSIDYIVGRSDEKNDFVMIPRSLLDSILELAKYVEKTKK